MRDLIKRLFKRKSNNLTEQRELGQKAKVLWDNPEFQRAVENVRLGIFERWAGAPLEDKDGQWTLRLMLKLLDDIEGNIRREISEGAYAEKLIKDEQEKQKRAKNITAFRR